MKRSSELTPLSHDHHHALVVALGLKRAEPSNAAAAAHAWFEFAASTGEDHFRIEEEILLPGWIVADCGADPSMISRTVYEHVEIRAAARRLISGVCRLDDLARLGKLLEGHVRFEERVLFPAIEASLDPDVIASLGEEIAAAEAALVQRFLGCRKERLELPTRGL